MVYLRQRNTRRSNFGPSLVHPRFQWYISDISDQTTLILGRENLIQSQIFMIRIVLLLILYHMIVENTTFFFYLIQKMFQVQNWNMADSEKGPKYVGQACHRQWNLSQPLWTLFQARKVALLHMMALSQLHTFSRTILTWWKIDKLG